jgi:hypothetical protein
MPSPTPDEAPVIQIVLSFSFMVAASGAWCE